MPNMFRFYLIWFIPFNVRMWKVPIKSSHSPRWLLQIKHRYKDLFNNIKQKKVLNSHISVTGTSINGEFQQPNQCQVTIRVSRCHSSMLTCHVDPHPLSDGLLVDSHWAGGPLQLPQGDTYKLVDSVETSPSNSCTSRGGMRGTGSRFAPYPLPCQGRLRRAGPLALLPP